MNYSYLIIGSNKKAVRTIQKCLDSSRHYFCLGNIDNDSTTIEKLIRKQPNLVFLFYDPLVKNTKFSFDTVNELFQYMEVVPYFVLLSTSPQFGLKAIQSGFSDYLLLPLDWHQLSRSLAKFKKRLPPVSVQSICIKSYSDYRFIDFKDMLDSSHKCNFFIKQ